MSGADVNMSGGLGDMSGELGNFSGEGATSLALSPDPLTF